MLFDCHTHFHDDARSRRAVADALVKLSSKDGSVIDWFCTLAAVLATSATSISNIMTVLEWTNALFAQPCTQLGRLQGQLLEKITSYEEDHRKTRLISSAVRNTRTAIANGLPKSSDPESMFVLLNDKSLAGLLFFTTAAGAAVDVMATYPKLGQLIEDHKQQAYAAYVAAVLGSKTRLTSSKIAALNPLFNDFTTQQDFDTVLVPGIAKCLLRAPEIVLIHIIPGLITSLPPIIDLSESTLNTLAPSLSGNFSSSKKEVTEGARTALSLILDRCYNPSTVEQITLKLITALKKVGSADQRALYGAVLQHVKCGTAQTCSALAPIVSKEINENALRCLCRALLIQFFDSIEESPRDDTIVTMAISKGITDKRPNLCNIWICELADVILERKISKPLASFVSSIKVSLDRAYKLVAANPNTASQNRSLASGYAYLCMVRRFSWNQDLTLIRSTAYQKLVDISDFAWAVRGFASTYFEEEEDSWFQSWIFFLTKSPIAVQRLGFSRLRELYAEQPIIGQGLTRAVYKHLESAPSSEDLRLVINIFNQVLTPDKTDQVEQNLVNLLVACHHPRARPKDGWIGLCLKCEIDPSSLVQKHLSRLIEHITLGNDVASYESAATLAFVNPSAFTPLLVAILGNLLTPQQISSEQIIIWKTPEGQLAVEETSKTYVENKKAKDYETKKWEESVRREIANKASQPQKLTKEQQELLLLQSEIRKSVRSIIEKHLQGIGFVTALSRQKVDNGVEQWLPVAVKKLIELLTVSKELVGQEAAECFLSLSNRLSARLDSSTCYLLGVATLRVFANEYVDSRFQVESLKDLVTRLLYKIKFLADQRSFDQITLEYMLPLILKTISGKGGIGTKDEEEIDEQVLLCLDIIGSHAEQFVPSDSRLELITSLISQMSIHITRAKQIKESLISVLQCTSINYNPQELKVILDAIMSGDTFVRTTVLEIVDAEFDISHIGYSSEIWISCFDEEEINRELGTTIWQENKLQLDEQSPLKIFKFLSSSHQTVRDSSATALAAALQQFPNQFKHILEQLVTVYVEKSQPSCTVYDKFGIVVKSDTEEQWHTRDGIAAALNQLANQLDSESIIEYFNFLITYALRDENGMVRKKMQNAGIHAVNLRGQENIELLIPIFENYLGLPDSQSDDRVSESVIILYGALARHLKPNDDRLLKIVDRLIATLDTPSEDVQYAVSQCLPPLVPLFAPELQTYINSILNRLFTAEKFGERRGAAYGLAGLVKGAGISALADYDIIRSLTDAVEDKKNPQKRQGGQFAFECLSQALGKYFEPYAIEITPLILACLGDTAPAVREATSYTAREIMKHTTGFGVKKLIPLILENLDTTAWRAKKGSVDMLGTMAYLDPRQLSSSLSTIIPEIVGVLNDTHKEVRNTANQSLKRFGEVIRNPEIQALVPVLVKAIGNPTKYTDEALDGLIKTSFIHYIDAPSLALIVHVVHRGLRDRSAATKRKACQIVGNMSILTDSNDLIPYLPTLVSELEIAMVDPMPATRATASKALGSLVEKLGEERFPNLIPRLMDVLKDPTRAGDRMGSAQALSEVIYGLGLWKLEELLPLILNNCVSAKPWIREGFMPLLLYLPACFGPSLSPYLKEIIPSILSGLADSVEGVRDTALKAGRRIVKNYASKALDLLLPELEKGLSDINHRIRLSSVELTGDLLFQVTGVTKNVDDSIVSGEVNKKLLEILGAERRDRILSLLFICRSDTSGLVRNSAMDVWKSLVANTPRTVKEILQPLTQMIIKRLASSEEEHRTIAAQTLGELVRRVGGNALSQVLPTLESLITSDSDAKQGICFALVELVQSTHPEVFSEYKAGVISIVRRALMDSDQNVREAAGHAFDAIQESQDDAVDDILPQLISSMESGDETALDALKEMMVSKSDVVFPVLIPTLLIPPMTKFKARSLGSLATVSGTALFKRLGSILDTLIDSLCFDGDSEDVEKALDSILISITQDEGAHTLMQHLLALAKNENAKRREITLKHMPGFFEQSVLDYSIYVADWVSHLISALDEREPAIVKGAFDSLVALVKRLTKEQLEQLVKPVRQTLAITGAPGTELPGFALPRGPSCVLPIFFQGLMYGTSDQREQAALGIAEVVVRASPDTLKPFVTQITGSLIRTIGERFPSDVKAAILYTLNLLVEKIPNLLKPFLPQLQRTFARSLADPSNELLRTRAAKALGTLITLQTRIDPLVNELVAGAQTPDSGVVKAMLQALFEVVHHAGPNLNGASRDSLVSLVIEMQAEEADLIILAKILGGVVGYEDNGKASKIVKQALHGDFKKEFTVLFFNALLKSSAEKIKQIGLMSELLHYFLQHVTDSQSFMSENAVLGLGKFIMLVQDVEEGVEETIFAALGKACTKSPNRSTDTRRFALIVIRVLSRVNRLRMIPHMNKLMVQLFSCVRDQVIPVKLTAEKAYIGLLDLVDNPDSTIFEQWFAAASNDGTISQQQQRSISDYTKRVAVKLAAAERDRIAAEGEDEALYSDRIEDENELWSIGGA